MGWQVFALAQVLLSTVLALLFRSTAQIKGISAGSKTALFFLLGLYPTALLWAFAHSQNVDFSFSITTLIVATLSGLFIAIANYSIFFAAETVDAARLTIILSLRAVVVIVLSGFFLSEFLSPTQIAGALLIIAAGYLATTHKHSEFKPSRGLVFAFIAALTFGIGIVLEKAALNGMSFETYIIVGWGMQTAWITLLALKQLRADGFENIKPFLPRLILMGVVLGLGGLSYIKAVVISDNVSLVSAFSNVRILLVVLGAYVFLGEKDNLIKKIAGGILSIIGLVLLVFTS